MDVGAGVGADAYYEGYNGSESRRCGLAERGWMGWDGSSGQLAIAWLRKTVQYVPAQRAPAIVGSSVTRLKSVTAKSHASVAQDITADLA